VHGVQALGNLQQDMFTGSHKLAAFAGLLGLMMLLPESAAAFRCGNKLVKDGMHELEVVAICGEPASRRHLGFAIRNVDYRSYQSAGSGWTISHSPGIYSYPAEVMVTEYVYNLGPRKFMRRLVFEDGLLVSIEMLGRGYRD